MKKKVLTVILVTMSSCAAHTIKNAQRYRCRRKIVFLNFEGILCKRWSGNRYWNIQRVWKRSSELAFWNLFELVPISEVPGESNVFSSHLIYRWKHFGAPNQFLRARIVPHENKDKELDELRCDSFSRKPEVLRLIYSFTSDMDYSLKTMDIGTAFLQTRSLRRQVYIRPTKEAKDTSHYWCLLKPVYGAVDRPIRWYQHSRKRLLYFGFKPSKINLNLYISQDSETGESLLILALQVDELFCTGTNEIFEILMKNSCNVCEVSEIALCLTVSIYILKMRKSLSYYLNRV